MSASRISLRRLKFEVAFRHGHNSYAASLDLMTDELHIEREGAGGLRAWIPLDEWCEQVRQAEGMRIAEDHQPRLHPATGKAVGFGETAGDAEVWFPADGVWRRIFRWDPAGFIAFSMPADFRRTDSRVRHAAEDIARRLRALIVGEGGEIFDRMM